MSMRLLSGLLFVALTGSVTLAANGAPPRPEPAETASKSRIPLRVVKLLPETHQVLLIDNNRGSHVVAEVGQNIDGYIVDDISGDEVTLFAPSGAEIILMAPDSTWRRRAGERMAVDATGAPAAPADALPVDPYADVPTLPAGDVSVASANPAPASTGPVRSVNAPPSVAGSVRSVSAPAPAPAAPYEDPNAGITAFAEAVGADTLALPPSSEAPAPQVTPDAASTLAAAATGSPTPTPASVGITLVVPRAEVDAALADFSATAVTFDATFVAAGLRIDSIFAGTLLEKAGLMQGDTIIAVDGKPLRSFDDAADLYARLPTARGATISVQRAGKPVTLEVAIR